MTNQEDENLSQTLEFVADYNIEKLQNMHESSGRLNNKALGLLGFIGVILAVLINSVDALSFDFFCLELIFMFGSILIMVSAILAGLACIPVPLDHKPSPEDLNDRIDMGREELLKLVAKNASEAYEHNSDMNNLKGSKIKWSVILLLVGLGLLMFWFIGNLTLYISV